MLGAALALGVAGLDPTPALIAVALILTGAGRRSISLLAWTVMVGGPLLGSVLALTVGSRVDDVDWLAILPRGQVAAIAGLAIGVILVVVGVVRIVRPAKEHDRDQHESGPRAALLAGAAYVAYLVIDPTFVAVTVLAGQTEPAWLAVAMECCWVLIAQLPLLGLLFAIHRVGRESAAEHFRRWWDKIKPVVRWVVTVALLVVGAAMVTDAVWWFGTGHFAFVDANRRT